MSAYLVIGIYEDDHTRFADTFEAETPAAAEELAVAQCPGLIVAGVLNDKGEVVA